MAKPNDGTKKDFIEALKKDLDDGYWFVPFVGAGLSVPAGVPSAPELKRYLTFCFLRAAGVNPLMDGGRNGKKVIKCGKPWNPRQLMWPRLAEEERVSRFAPKTGRGRFIPTGDLDKLLQDLASNDGDLPIEGRCPASKDLLREAYGSLSDWRSALLLLSRLSLEESHEGTPILCRTAPEPSVVDSFFTHLVGGKNPTLGHRMIHSLSTVLRADVILTTNFDDLIERSFTAAGTPLAVFEVPLNARLPVARLVNPQKSLVKLHGGRFGVRADYTTDVHPTRADRWHFLSYLAGRPLDRSTQELPEDILRDARLSDKVALLVCGVSGEDARTCALIKLALTTFARMQIYWICFTKGDEERAHTLLPKWSLDNERCHVLRHPDHGLLLLEIFQHCTNSLPMSGVIVPTLWQVPTPPLIPEPTLKNQIDTSLAPGNYRLHFEQIMDTIRRLSTEGNKERIQLIVSPPNISGAITLASNAFFEDVYPPTKNVWLSLDDVTEPAGLFLRLALIIGQLHGEENPISTLDSAAFYDEHRHQDFAEAMRVAMSALALKSGQRMIVFINAQRGVGKDPMFVPRQSNHRTWTDDNAVGKLVDLLEELASDDACGVGFILLTQHVSKPHESEPECPLAAAVARRVTAAKDDEDSCWMKPLVLIGPCSDFEPGQVTQKLLHLGLVHQDAKDNSEALLKCLCLLLLTFFRIPRYVSTIVRILDAYRREMAVGADGDQISLADFAVQVTGWLQEFARSRGIRHKVGGLVWMDWQVKNNVREELLAKKQFSPSQCLKLQGLIARSYGRLLLSSSDPLAAVECLHHSVQGILDYHGHSELTHESVPDLRLIPILLEHAALVFRTGKTVLKTKLSDQFADYSLKDLEDKCANAWRLLSASRDQFIQGLRPDCGPEGDLLSHVTSCMAKTMDLLKSISESLVLTRYEMYLLEGGFEKFTGDKKEPERLIGGPSHEYDDAMTLNQGVAFICLRDYAKADAHLLKLWNDLKGSPAQIQPVYLDAQEWLSRYPEQQSRRKMVQVARQLMYLRMHQSQANFLAGAYGVWTSEEGFETNRQQRLKERHAKIADAMRYCNFALELLRGIPDSSDGFVYEQNARLRAHAGLCMGIMALGTTREGDDFSHQIALGRSHLIDAEAYIEEFPLKEAGHTRAVLELRRAELQLIEAGASGPFRAYRRSLRQRLKDAVNDPLHPGKVNGIGPVGQAFQMHAVYDALRSLSRAETELRQHPKSRWWWWLLLVLRMKACEFLYCYRLMAEEVSGQLKATRAGETSTGAYTVPPVMTQFLRAGLNVELRDRGLTDAWQLARITESYVRTIFVMELHSENRPRNFLYEVGFNSLVERLRRALESKHLDEEVRSYSSAVLKMASGFHEKFWQPRKKMATST